MESFAKSVHFFGVIRVRRFLPSRIPSGVSLASGIVTAGPGVLADRPVHPRNRIRDRILKDLGKEKAGGEEDGVVIIGVFQPPR